MERNPFVPTGLAHEIEKFFWISRNGSGFASTTEIGIGADSARALPQKVLVATAKRDQEFSNMVRIDVMYFDN